jgi:hypothetical protein
MMAGSWSERKRPWSERKRNPKFPHCAEVARHMLAEAIGLKFGDQYPPEDELLRRAAEVAAAEEDTMAKDRAVTALAMLDEIGGL